MGQKMPVSEADKQKSYYKYYERNIYIPPREVFDKAVAAPLNPQDALSIFDRNRLFDPDYVHKTGYCCMIDECGYSSSYLGNITPMPGVTGEMFDWWFGWHSIDSLRYKIWDPEDHAFALNQNMDRVLDETLPVRERNWYCTHHVDENIFSGHPYGFLPDSSNSGFIPGPPPDFSYMSQEAKLRKEAYSVPYVQEMPPIALNFLPPAEMGFDTSLIGTNRCSTIVCANNGPAIPGEGAIITSMCHFLRPVEGGSELLSCFWGGYHIYHGEVTRMAPRETEANDFFPMMLLLHCIKEFNNLASFLPQLYKEEKDHWGL